MVSATSARACTGMVLVTMQAENATLNTRRGIFPLLLMQPSLSKSIKTSVFQSYSLNAHSPRRFP